MAARFAVFETPAAAILFVVGRAAAPGAGNRGKVAAGVLFCAGVTAGTEVFADAGAAAAEVAFVGAALAAGAFVRRAGIARVGTLFVVGAAGAVGSSAACALNARAAASDRSLRIGFTVIPVVKAADCRRIKMSGRWNMQLMASMRRAHDGCCWC